MRYTQFLKEEIDWKNVFLLVYNRFINIFAIAYFWLTGKAKDLVDSGNNTYGGKYVINPSGGLISKGHPLGATGKSAQWKCTLFQLPVSQK